MLNPPKITCCPLLAFTAVILVTNRMFKNENVDEYTENMLTSQ